MLTHRAKFHVAANVYFFVDNMEVAPATQITFDLYGKLCNLSGKFKRLFDRGQQEQQQYGNMPTMY